MNENERQHIHNLRNKYVRINAYLQFKEMLMTGKCNNPEKMKETVERYEETIFDDNREFVEMLQRNE